MKRYGFIVALALFGSTGAMADTYLAEWASYGSDPGGDPSVQLSDGTTPTGNTLDVVATSGGANEQFNISQAADGSRYTRARIDLRNSGSLFGQGYSFNEIDGGGYQWLVGSGTFSTNQTQGSSAAMCSSGSPKTSGTPGNGWTANDGTGAEEINWCMSGEEGGTDLGSAGVIAWGLIWTDVNANDAMDPGDIVSVKYVVGADTFAEIDTVAELEAAIVSTAPLAPLDVTALPLPGEVELNWAASDPTPDFYTVYRSEESGTNYAQVATGLTANTYTDTSVSNGSEYYYVVTVTAGGVESSYSSEVSALPSDVPLGLGAGSTWKVSLGWTPMTDPALDFYTVYRSEESGSNYTEIATSITTNVYEDTAVSIGTTYYYVVTYTDTDSVESGYSAEAGAKPVNLPPTGFTATGQEGAVALDWDDTTNPAFESYKVYRSTESGTNYTEIATVGVSEYTDSSAVAGTPYYYVVTEVDGGSETGFSAERLGQATASEFVLLDINTQRDNGSGVPIPVLSTLGGIEVSTQTYLQDPLDNTGRMDRYYLRFDASNKRYNGHYLHAGSGGLGYTGSDVLSTNDTAVNNVSFRASGDVFNVPTNTVLWYAYTAEQADSSGNDTAFNDMAFAVILQDLNGNNVADAGDTMEVLGIVYSQGDATVFGKTADEMTALLNLDATPFEAYLAGFGLSGTDLDADADPDGDGLKNLGEYAFGGNPNDGGTGDVGVQPALTDAGGMKYIYEIVDDPTVLHQVETETDLVVGGGSLTVTLDGSGAGRTGYNAYTNSVDTVTENKGFLWVEISQ
ncbi:fibronectin type III domain-containing protein [Pontiella desulfatans]|nr:hypothetical protein [Pontiella desulfatans]